MRTLIPAQSVSFAKRADVRCVPVLIPLSRFAVLMGIPTRMPAQLSVIGWPSLPTASVHLRKIARAMRLTAPSYSARVLNSIYPEGVRCPHVMVRANARMMKLHVPMMVAVYPDVMVRLIVPMVGMN